MPGLNGISSTVLLVGRLGCGLTSLPFTMLKKIEALAGPSQLPTSVGEPVNLMRPSGQRGAGAAGGCARRACGAGAACCASTVAAVARPSAIVPMTRFLMAQDPWNYCAWVPWLPARVWLLEEAAPSTSPELLRVTRRALAVLLPSRASQPSTDTSSPMRRLLRFQPAFCSMCGGPISKPQLLTFWVLGSVTST